MKPKLEVVDCLQERMKYPQYQGPVSGESIARLGARVAIVVECESLDDPRKKILVTLYPRG